MVVMVALRVEASEHRDSAAYESAMPTNQLRSTHGMEHRQIPAKNTNEMAGFRGFWRFTKPLHYHCANPAWSFVANHFLNRVGAEPTSATEWPQCVLTMARHGAWSILWGSVLPQARNATRTCLHRPITAGEEEIGLAPITHRTE